MTGHVKGVMRHAYTSLQVLIVGDLNIAASQLDVYDKLDRDKMYSQEEKEIFAGLLQDYTGRGCRR